MTGSSMSTIPSPSAWAGWRAGRSCFMASYNAWNKVPMTANPIIPNVVIKDWGVDGVICTDAGSLGNMVRGAPLLPGSRPRGRRGDQGGHQPVSGHTTSAHQDALDQNLMTEADIDNSHQRHVPDLYPSGPAGSARPQPLRQDRHRCHRPLDHAESQGFRPPGHAGVGRPAQEHRQFPAAGQDRLQIHRRHWPARQRGRQRLVWQHSPHTTVTPLAGIKSKVGDAVNVQFADGKDVPAAVALAKSSDVAIVCVGNSPEREQRMDESQ